MFRGSLVTAGPFREITLCFWPPAPSLEDACGRSYGFQGLQARDWLSRLVESPSGFSSSHGKPLVSSSSDPPRSASLWWGRGVQSWTSSLPSSSSWILVLPGPRLGKIWGALFPEQCPHVPRRLGHCISVSFPHERSCARSPEPNVCPHPTRLHVVSLLSRGSSPTGVRVCPRWAWLVVRHAVSLGSRFPPLAGEQPGRAECEG